MLGAVIDALRQRYWVHARRQALLRWSRSLPRLSAGPARYRALFVAEEFFHQELRGFGGFGRAVKSVAQHFNTQPDSGERFAMALAQPTPLVQRVELREYHDTPVLLRPSAGDYLDGLRQWQERLLALGPGALLCIDWYPSYLTTALALPDTPLLIWIRDPRPTKIWRRISQVPGEREFQGLSSTSAMHRRADEKKASMRLLLRESRRRGRQVVFCSKSPWLNERARATYGLPDLQPHDLPTPLDGVVPRNLPPLSQRPSLLFLGRLDPIKRPWIACAIAERHSELDVIVAGQMHQSTAMLPRLEPYLRLPNLKLAGHVEGEAKEALLAGCWALLNTSAHEAEPISFLEAFRHGKPVLFCHASDEPVAEYGYYAGPVDGDGLDEASLRRFDRAIATLLTDPAQREAKGAAARAFVESRHTHSAFLGALREIYRREGIGA